MIFAVLSQLSVPHEVHVFTRLEDHSNFGSMGSIATPTRNKAVVYDKPGSISTKIVDLDIPEPGPGEVLLRLCVQGRHSTFPNRQCSNHLQALTREYATPTLLSC